jgi:CRISPR-associated protein Cas1
MTIPLHVTIPGAVLRTRKNRLVIEDGDDVLASVPVFQVHSVTISSAAGATTGTLLLLLRRGIPTTFITGSGRALGRLSSYRCSEPADRIRQYGLLADPDRRLALARPMVKGKLHNQRVLLRRRNRRPRDTMLAAIAGIDHALAQCDRAGTVDELRGMEGAAARHYHHALRALVPESCRGPRRDRKGADLLNNALNYAGGLLRETIVSIIVGAGLDPQLPVFHQPYRNRPALAFDLMEEWRPILVDAVALATIGLGSISPDDLVHEDGEIRIRHAGRRQLVHRFLGRLGDPGDPASRHSSMVGQVALYRAAIRAGGPDYVPMRWTR